MKDKNTEIEQEQAFLVYIRDYNGVYTYCNELKG